jgi:3-oxoacyl-[acyl-carrier-protein] synthase III
MKAKPLYIAGVGAYLPPRQTAAEAIADGTYDAESARIDDVASVCVEPSLYPAEMAAAAGRAALQMAGDRARNVRAVFHSYVDYQGAHYWQAAPYVAMHTVGPSVPAFDVVQECNGGMGSIELGRRFLDDEQEAVLITTGDRFDSPWISRWYGDQSVLADGGSALVLSASGGFAKITALVTQADNSLEAEARGATFRPAGGQRVIDFDEMRKQFHAESVPMLEHYTRMEAVLRRCIDQVMAEADITPEQLAYLLPVATTKPRAEVIAERFFGIPIERTNWPLGRTTGHLSTGDQFVGLHDLITAGKVRRGDRILLLGGGTGYTLTAAVVEIQEDL